MTAKYEDTPDVERLSRDQLIEHLAQAEARVHDLEDQLNTQQVTDSLTGLANRGYFFAALARLWQRAKRFEQEVCLALIDVDNFRSINELHGHMAGDMVLAGLADVLRSITREYDLLARFGDEEFAIAIDNGDDQTARQLADRVRQALASAPICVNDRTMTVTVTVGVATGRPVTGEERVESLVSAAIQAVEMARLKGANQMQCLQLSAVE